MRATAECVHEGSGRLGQGLGIERPERPLRVLIADDHPLVLLGVRRMLEANEDIEVAGEAQSGPEALALVERRRPDVVLLDLRMPGVEGGSLIAEIIATFPDVKVVVLSASDDAASVSTALDAGASAYVLKSIKPIDIAAILRQVSGGEMVFHPAPSVVRGGPSQGAALASEDTGLTERERTILTSVARGMTTKAISKDLWVSEHTVKFHLTNIYRKLGVPNRSGAVRYAVENGLGV